MGIRQFGGVAAVVAILALATPAHAVTEIQWWHAMTGGNNDVIVKLASDYNASQNDYRVVPAHTSGSAHPLNTGNPRFRAGSPPPRPPGPWARAR